MSKIFIPSVQESAYKLHMIGEHTDIIHYSDGSIIKLKGHNIVVSSFIPLVLRLLKKEENIEGIQYWAVGSGASSWDSTLPLPSASATQLTNEIGRVAISSSEITFLDSRFDEVDYPTNIIQVKHLFGVNDCNGTWREFGLFGGNATSTANSGILIDKRHHSVITKTSDMTVERILRFTLTLV